MLNNAKEQLTKAEAALVKLEKGQKLAALEEKILVKGNTDMLITVLKSLQQKKAE
ncbi:11252_t:CDS:2 [Paraglomus brasilianum]|uniref:11252_t:CDS:1 n=1 Tax=Paraglomus brasilianum TaxID=144538 RepID=A0A9N9CDI7_9GLOM|nr:11252_t:CDS:2 [Paraglomus brasilianum]